MEGIFTSSPSPPASEPTSTEWSPTHTKKTSKQITEHVIPKTTWNMDQILLSYKGLMTIILISIYHWFFNLLEFFEKTNKHAKLTFMKI